MPHSSRRLGCTRWSPPHRGRRADVFGGEDGDVDTHGTPPVCGHHRKRTAPPHAGRARAGQGPGDAAYQPRSQAVQPVVLLGHLRRRGQCAFHARRTFRILLSDEVTDHARDVAVTADGVGCRVDVNADYLRALPTPTWQQVATTNRPATRVAAFKADVSGAPGRIRTYAHGSGGRCSIP